MSTTVYDELSSVLKLKYKSGTDVQDYLRKVLDKADKLSDTQWDKLSEETQEWVNSAVDAHESGNEIPIPEGLDLGDDEDEDEDLPDLSDLDDEDEDEDDEDEDNEPAPRRAATKNGRGGKHATAKKARAAAADDDNEDEDEEVVAPKKRGRPAAKKAAKETKPAKGKAAKAAKPEKTEKKAKGKAATKPEKKTKKAGTGGGRRERLFKDDQVITVLADENPKRPHTASFERFELYYELAKKKGKKGFTVREALDAGVLSADLKWDSEHNYIKIS